jgi:putrescine transport system ATP-binding protein
MSKLRRGACGALALCAAVLFFGVPAASAQQSLGTLRGNVKDELGGVIYVDHGISSAPGATVWAAVRPEKINILRQQPEDISENCVKGVVKEIAYMGDVSIYLVKIDTGKIVRVTLPNVERLSDDERILWDETVWLTWHGSSPVVVTQ